MDNKIHVWWEEPERNLHKSLYAAFDSVAANDTRLADYGVYLSLYKNRQYAGTTLDAIARANGLSLSSRTYSRLPLNIVKQYLDQVHARIGKIKLRPRFVTEAGNFSLQLRAKLLQRWSDHMYEKLDLQRKASMAVRDALLYGIGILKPYRVGKELYVDNVFPGELYVDPYEAAAGDVRQMFQTKYISKRVLMRRYPKFKTEIERAQIENDLSNTAIGMVQKYRSGQSDLVKVVEAWRLPSACEAGDGRWAIAIENATLDSEEWEDSEFPFAYMRWTEDPHGFYGIGLAEELLGIQLDINVTLERIKKQVELQAVPRVFYEAGSIKEADITNVPGSLVPFNGSPPIFDTPQGVSADTMSFLQWQISEARNIARLSDSDFGAGVPSGLETGAAVREFRDAVTQGLALPMESYDAMNVATTRWLVKLARQAYKEDKSFGVVTAKDRYSIQRVNWADVDMDEDSYVLRVYPSSGLPLQPAARLDAINYRLSAGLITPEEARRMDQLPDLAEEDSLASAQVDNIRRIIENILDEGVYTQPDPFIDINLAIKYVSAAYNRAVLTDTPEDRLRMLRDLAKSLNSIQKKKEQEAMNAQIAQQQAMQAAMAPPVTATGQDPMAITGQEPA